MDTVSDDEVSSVWSLSTSEMASTIPRKKKSRQKITSYMLAGPAPTLSQKQSLLHIRPKLVMQIQRLSESHRPVPIFDIMTSTQFVPRLAKKFPSLYKGTGKLGLNDVMVTTSENYEDDILEEDEESKPYGKDDHHEREVIAVICGPPKDSASLGEICLEDGSRWQMRSGEKKSLELVKNDARTGREIVGRWIRRHGAPTSRRNSLKTPERPTDLASSPTANDGKYIFSFIDPLKTRHPVQGKLSKGKLQIYDTYNPNTDGKGVVTSGRTSFDGDLEATSPISQSSDDATAYATTTAEQRLIIELSGIWVASRIGWCPWLKYDHSSPASTKSTPPSAAKSARERAATPTPSGSGRHKRERSGTTNTITSIAESVVSSVGGSGRARRSRRTSANRDTLPPDPSNTSSKAPQRAVSTGAAFMQRVAEKRASYSPSLNRDGSESSKNGSKNVSRPGSRPGSPKGPCSMDMLSRATGQILGGQPPRRGSATMPPSKMRRTLSAFDVLSGDSAVSPTREGQEVKIGATNDGQSVRFAPPRAAVGILAANEVETELNNAEELKKEAGRATRQLLPSSDGSSQAPPRSGDVLEAKKEGTWSKFKGLFKPKNKDKEKRKNTRVQG